MNKINIQESNLYWIRLRLKDKPPKYMYIEASNSTEAAKILEQILSDNKDYKDCILDSINYSGFIFKYM